LPDRPHIDHGGSAVGIAIVKGLGWAETAGLAVMFSLRANPGNALHPAALDLCLCSPDYRS